ncbi:MAG: hypothetical protein HZB23_00325 [Deltaproteobacteria bacterium]|nr:hypothetical protein [Deltaproteobacteria bacterium]
MDETPIMTYKDASISRKQTLTLTNESVNVKGKVFFKAEYEASFPLNMISPEYHKIFMRYNIFWASILFAIISFIAAKIYYSIPGASIETTIGRLITVMPVPFIVTALLTYKKIRVAVFNNRQGQALFVIIEDRKKKDTYGDIVEAIARTIKKNEQDQENLATAPRESESDEMQGRVKRAGRNSTCRT